jgi:hypothetical protein
MTDNIQQDVLTEDIFLQPVKRSKLIPVWIKVFSWIFIVFGALAPIGFIFGLLGYNMDLSLYGLETNVPLSILGVSVMMLFLFKGVTAFGLLKEKDWAINLAIADAVVGMSICVLFMIYKILYFSSISLRLELALLIPYFLKIRSIKNQWEVSSIS